MAPRSDGTWRTGADFSYVKSALARSHTTQDYLWLQCRIGSADLERGQWMQYYNDYYLPRVAAWYCSTRDYPQSTNNDISAGKQWQLVSISMTFAC